MFNEPRIIKSIITSRDAFGIVRDHLDGGDLSPDGACIFEAVSSFYKSDPQAPCCDVEILKSRIERSSRSNKAAESAIRGIDTALAQELPSAINLAKEALNARRYSVGLKLAGQLTSTSPASKELLREYLDLSHRQEHELGEITEEIYRGVSAASLSSKSFNKAGLIKLWPESLNIQVDGGVRGGHHIVIFAPTEMGKTLFVINLCAGFLKQGLRVLYIGNEDPASDIMMRMMARLTGMNKYEIIENPDKADGILASRNWDKFTFAALCPGTFDKIDELAEETQAQVLILDQLRNIDMDSESRTQALEKAATEARNLARRRNIPVVSVTQAGDSASGRAILDRGDIDSSNVGIPAQADLMLGIGATPDMEASNMRTLSFPKNKLSGNHTPISVLIDPMLSKVIDV